MLYHRSSLISNTRTILSSERRPSPLASSTPSWPQRPPPPTPKTAVLSTWFNGGSTYSSGRNSTPIVPVTVEQFNSNPSWTLSYLLGIESSHLTPKLNTSSTPRRSSLPCTARRKQSEGGLSPNSDMSWHQPDRFDQASTYFSACDNMGAQGPPRSVTTLTSTSGSALSAPRTSSQSS